MRVRRDRSAKIAEEVSVERNSNKIVELSEELMQALDNEKKQSAEKIAPSDKVHRKSA